MHETKYIENMFVCQYVVLSRKEIVNMLWDKVETELNKRNMSIYQLTVKAGLPRNNRTMYEFKYGHIKKPSFELMCRIADALDVSLDVFR